MVVNMLKRLSLYTLLLCIVPFFAWIFTWQWDNKDLMTDYDYPLYVLTETGSVPYAVITCGVFTLLFFPLFHNKKQWILGVVVMAFSVILTQGIKSGLKTIFSEPRPYVVYIAEEAGITVEHFYAQDRKIRSQFVDQFYQARSDIPTWLKGHYEKEVGYAFPSGHTIFAATWLMLAVGFVHLLGVRSLGAKLLVVTTAIWAVFMLFSRLRFGMHYPIDLFVSTLIAFLVHWAIFAFLYKKAIFINK
ncbi:phosphatase PAP2 family protein [Pasteurella canis]|nr:phosphatase PAP2 family protein [Pasteurella canis]UAX42967.1 phosphatase PAP2 family protein [Pasteurella canis]UDW84553.1 phosphatase PAP2 family protein [Pasteurella canis]UEC24092.1 phosphatase PAP2 family protein [Pasteurella canis]